jgi:uncharacterized protein YgiM (DUF1202 family)
MDLVKDLIRALWRLMLSISRSISRLIKWWISRIRGSGSRKGAMAWLFGGLVTVCLLCSLMLSIFPRSSSDTAERLETPTLEAIAEATAFGESPETVAPTPGPTNTIQPTVTPEPPTSVPPTSTSTVEPTSTLPPTFTPNPTATPVPKVRVSASSANLRSGPGTEFVVVGTANVGDVMTVLATDSGADWFNVVLGTGETGWISTSVVEAIDSLNSVSVALTIPAPPTSPPIPTSPPAPTSLPAPTSPPLPTSPPAPSPAQVVIVSVNKRAEYVDIRNDGGTDQNLQGWTLVSERGNQSCPLGGVLSPGGTLRIWALASDANQGGYNCGFGNDIWNNDESDPAVLYDANGREVSRR